MGSSIEERRDRSQRAARKVAMDLDGIKVSHYRLVARLGEGGMGVVYRAHDDRLQRDVAIKLLPPALVADTAARARLIREARLASALNHPNICTIFETDVAAGQTFIAMELVDGHPLERVIPEAGLPAQTVCRYGAQIADALDHAHRRGIVHRDLKPSNVMVTCEGRIKVLDFGLSRHSPESIAGRGDVSTSLTAVDAVVGTPLYLAPEVWRGEKGSERSDIWALGVVIYQMAAGVAPFTGATEYELCAAIMNADPAPIPERVPRALAGVILRCLGKEPAHRFGSAAEVRSALETLAPDPAHAAVLPRRRSRRGLALTLAAVMTTLVIVGLAWRVMIPEQPAGEPRLTQLTFNSAENPVVAAAISPDGRYLAYADQTQIMLRLIETGETRSLAVPESWAVMFPYFACLTWFPDGTRLLANSGTGTWKMSIQGGPPQRVPYAGVVSPDGAWIAFARGRALCRVSTGGTAEETLMSSPGRAWSPAWSQDGRWIAFLRGDSTSQSRKQVWRFDTRSKRAALVLSDSLLPTPVGIVPFGWGTIQENFIQWLKGGRLIFPREAGSRQVTTNLWCVRLHSRTGQAVGNLKRLTSFSDGAVGYPSASADGSRLTFLRWGTQSDVCVSSFEPGGTRLAAPRRLTLDDRSENFLRWARGRSAVVFGSDRAGRWGTFVQGLDERVPAPIADDRSPPWESPRRADTITVVAGAHGGRRLIVMTPIPPFRFGCTVEILAVNADGSGVRKLARVESPTGADPAVSPDSSRLALAQGLKGITIVELASGNLRRVGLGGLTEFNDVSWMSDGRSLIGTAMLGDTNVVYRAPLEGPPKILWRSPDMISDAVPSPDGRYVAFTRFTRTSNVWLFEMF